MTQSGRSGEDRLEQFEQKVVFRTARGYFVVLAVIAMITFATGMFFGARGAVKLEPDAPAEPLLPTAPPAPKPLALADVEAWMQKQREAPTTIQEHAEPEWVAEARDSVATTEDPEKGRFIELLARLKALFPEPAYSWTDTYSRTCARQSAYGCLRYERKLEKEGVSDVLEEAIGPELRADSLRETNAALEVLVSVLGSAPEEQRMELLVPTGEAYRELQGGYRASVRDHERAIADLRDEYEARLLAYQIELDELRAEKERDMATGVYGVLAGLGLLVLVSVFLAHFAIERHLRLVREALVAGRA